MIMNNIEPFDKLLIMCRFVWSCIFEKNKKQQDEFAVSMIPTLCSYGEPIIVFNNAMNSTDTTAVG